MKQNLELCLWKEMSLNPKSTTFQDVKEETHDLYKCKFSCDGYNGCENYRSKKTLKILNYQNEENI